MSKDSLSGVPDNLNAVTKMVNDTLRKRKQSNGDIQISFNGIPIIPIAIQELDINLEPLAPPEIHIPICGECEKPIWYPPKDRNNCECTCHEGFEHA